MTVDAKPRHTQCFQGRPLFRKSTLALFQREVRVEIQPPLRHDIRLECPDCACGSIPGVRCGSHSLLLAFPVHFQKSLVRKDHFSPHFETLSQLGAL